jgi:hypothetical protein
MWHNWIAFQKGGIHNNQHTKILTISHRQVHHANDIDNEKKNNPLDQHSCLLKSRWYPNVMSYLLGELRSLEFIVLFSVGEKLFIHRIIQCWWKTFHSSYYSVLMDHVFAVPYQYITTFQLFKSDSIHNQYFKIYPGCIAFQKGGIHNNQHTKILTISHRQVHHVLATNFASIIIG